MRGSRVGDRPVEPSLVLAWGLGERGDEAGVGEAGEHPDGGPEPAGADRSDPSHPSSSPNPAARRRPTPRGSVPRPSVPVVPDGAFYVWAQTQAHAKSSWDFCFELMRRAHVVLTPGRDFGPAMAEDYLRLSFATSVAHLDTALQRLQRVL